jgi:hypothetical protein
VGANGLAVTGSEAERIKRYRARKESISQGLKPFFFFL